MDVGNLLIGNVAIASIVIKTIISGVKKFVPLKKWIYPAMAAVLGILTAFAIDISMFSVATQGTIANFAQHILAGLFIGATAIGVNESTKMLRKS